MYMRDKICVLEWSPRNIFEIKVNCFLKCVFALRNVHTVFPPVCAVVLPSDRIQGFIENRKCIRAEISVFN